MLGVVRANDPGIVLDGMLDRIQRDLFALGARLADPRHKIAARVEKASVDDQDVARLEGWIDDLEAGVTPLRKFILAGGSPAGAHAASGAHRLPTRRARHRRARRGRRRAGRRHYLNRLSDLLFVMARAANARAGADEIEW